MHIITLDHNKGATVFGQVPLLQAFEYEGLKYIRVPDASKHNAVCLDTGSLYHFPDNQDVVA